MTISATTPATVSARHKPHLGFFQIWNMAFGFFGLQIGFALQNANASRIFQSLGGELDALPLLWLAGPVTGLLVQPIIGYMSDKTWGRFGRRRPYFFIGAIFASLALLVMPYSPLLWIAAGSLWILDASLNISMEPFRAFVGDNLSTKQRTLGYAMQGFMIGGGGYVASKLPNWLTAMGVANTSDANQVPDSVKFAFLIGAGLLFLTVLWTIVTTKEYTPEDLEAFDAADNSELAQARRDVREVPPSAFFFKWAAVVIGLGSALVLLVLMGRTDKQFAVFASALIFLGLLFLITAARLKSGKGAGMVGTLMGDLVTMPTVMKRLAAVQFTTWFAFFIMWIYLTPAVTSYHFGATDAGSAAYGEGSLAVNNIFAIYSIVAFLFSLLIPIIVRYVGLKLSYALALAIGGMGVMSIFFFKDAGMFWLSATAIGIAWACVLTLPYSILADALPPKKMGTYMGIFNFFIVIPQIVVGTIMGPIVKTFLGNEAIYALVVGGVVMMLGALLLVFVPYKKPVT
ncbi:MFS transporter [Litorimonas sp. RW-G-Af-16]|uniref:MFS transporter n=1 Tax=Litorimonas sp. RW-G-Af-16 TaxID=3241168 RepID=UPI00390C9B36